MHSNEINEFSTGRDTVHDGTEIANKNVTRTVIDGHDFTVYGAVGSTSSNHRPDSHDDELNWPVFEEILNYAQEQPISEVVIRFWFPLTVTSS